MFENRQHLLGTIVRVLRKARITPLYPMHDPAWDLDAELWKDRPNPGTMREALERLFKASPLAESDNLLVSCAQALRAV